MDAQYFLTLNKEQYERFLAQDSDDDEFDVVFDIGGKRLCANKYKLCSVSTTFKSMLSERWTKPNEPIKIQDYAFDDFKEFITFIYSGGCELTDNNILTMVDMAEFYQVGIFKKKCEDFLLKTVLDLKNAYPMLENSYKYSLEVLKKSILDFSSHNLLQFIKDEQFQEISQPAIRDFVELNQNTLRQEELFEMVYEWTENQALKIQTENGDLSLNETIKNQLAPVLPFFKFKSMKNEFLLKFVVSKSFLFTGNEMSDILWGARYAVILVDGNEKIMKGVLDCNDNDRMCDIIHSLKNAPSTIRNFKCKCNNDPRCERCSESNYWKICQGNYTRALSKIVEDDNISWYFVLHLHCNLDTGFIPPIFAFGTIYDFITEYDRTGFYLAVKHRNQIDKDDCLLAEMVAEDGFQLDSAKFV